MNRQPWAITTCRVSTPEQKENNSLGRQAEAVLNAAKHLGAYIPTDGQWSGSISSKAGTNTKRKDLLAMLDYCKKHKQVKYLLVHEVDRFMRSLKELFYFEVEFEKLGVTVWYASQPELNSNDHNAKLLKALEAFKGEGSNVERQRKSIAGDITAVKQGRYPFAPKPGYKKGSEPGIPAVHPIRGPILKEILIAIATGRLEPSQALIELNSSDFMKGHSPYRMDKFRKIITDPFYAGIVEVDKQVKVRNENGLHVPLITKNMHYKILQIMDGRGKNQTGPRKNGNPKYPCNNIVSCDTCRDKTNIGRVVGFDHGNGKPNSKVYEKYRCRGCGMYLTRDELHRMVAQQFKDHPITPEGRDELIKALNVVWKQRAGEAEQEATRINYKISSIRTAISNQVDAATDSSNADIKDEILAAIAKKKSEVADLEGQLVKLTENAAKDKEEFLRFALDFINNMGARFLEISHENRLRCKQVVFPAGFWLNENKKVYTPEISPLYSLAATKKGAFAPNFTQLVRVTGL